MLLFFIFPAQRSLLSSNAQCDECACVLWQQATAEQIRLAQMISDHSDADFEEKVKQVRGVFFCPFFEKLLPGFLRDAPFVDESVGGNETPSWFSS